ncbi:MAG: cytochrome c3 family protein, partial [Deltaproteobacteria bacterium]|nr:cytochrome c3 family protein [Deltaproteobacteria bacterium]
MTPRKKGSRRELTVAFLAFISAAVVACATVKIHQRVQAGHLAKSLIFDHAAHVENADCSDCHDGIDKSTTSTGGTFIGKGDHGGCAACHEDETKDKKKCEMCHQKGTPKKIKLTRVNRMIHFSHKKHEAIFAKRAAKLVADAKAQGKKDFKAPSSCKHCHKAAYTNKLAGMPMLGKMAVCTDACHKQDLSDQTCTKCHTKLQRQRLAAVAQLGHRDSFLRRHGTAARNSGRCAQCHDQTYCADCHARTAAMPLSIRYPEKVNASFIHRGDFLGRHAVQARAQPATCKKCHGNQYCTSCHEMRGVVRRLPQRLSQAARKVHAAQWMTPGQPGFHGRKARRNAARCASCHDQGAASNCVRCHKVGALGGNPHPRSFKWA